MKKNLLLLLFMASSIALGFAANLKGKAGTIQREAVKVQPEKKVRPVVEPVNQADTVAQTEESDDEIYKYVEKKAQFPGGMDKLMEYLRSNVIYPQKALESGIQGRVYVTFVVRKDGSIDDPKVSRSVDPILDAEALRVVREMPDGWKPATVNGKDVSSYFTLPLIFSLMNL